MNDKSPNSIAANEAKRSPFQSGRPDRIKAALYTKDDRSANTKPSIKIPRNAKLPKKRLDSIEKMQSKQREKLGAGPKRKASDSLSEILGRQKTDNNTNAKGFNSFANSANDDIAHAEQLLEGIKNDSNKKPIFAALIFSAIWIVLCVAITLSLLSSGVIDLSLISFSSLPILISISAVLFIPCILSWGVAVFLWRARELHQISLSLAYTALHLTQPEDMAGAAIATIGQAVRREVAAMGDGIDRAINRATTLESKFRNEVGNIQGFYRNNENIFNKIIDDLKSERDLMSATGDDLEAKLPKILDSLKESSFDFSKIVQSADQRFTALAKTADTRLEKLGSSIASKTNLLKSGLDKTIDDITQVGVVLEKGTNTLSSVTEKLSSTGNSTTAKLDKISGNFKRQTTELGHATAAILKANEKINVALQSRHEDLSTSAEDLVQNAEQINNLLTSFTSVMDKSFINAENSSLKMQNMLRSAAKDSASTLQNETQAAFSMLLKQSKNMSDGLKIEANEIAQIMHREIQMFKDTAVGSTEEGLIKLRKSHEYTVANIIVRIEEAGKRLSGTADNLEEVTTRMDDEMEATRVGLSRQISKMPDDAKQALSEMQLYINDQVGALSDLASMVGGLSNVASAPEASRHLTQPARQTRPPETDNNRYSGNMPAPAQARREPVRATPARRNVARQGREKVSDKRKWEMPELLSRASDIQPLPEHLQPRSRSVEPQQNHYADATRPSNELHSGESLNSISLELARALDHDAPEQLWARYRNGERNVFTRKLYTLRGQKLFDEVSFKYRNDAGFRHDVDRYIADFEGLLTKVYEQDRDSMLIDTYLSSETGKIYLMLAHASGRLD